MHPIVLRPRREGGYCRASAHEASSHITDFLQTNGLNVPKPPSLPSGQPYHAAQLMMHNCVVLFTAVAAIRKQGTTIFLSYLTKVEIYSGLTSALPLEYENRP